MEKQKKTIFEVLFEKEICFTVNVSVNIFKGKGIDDNSRDYFLIILKKSLEGVYKKELAFHKMKDYPNLLERDLSVLEIAEFKTLLDKFVKVQHSKLGRIYELKNNSFKKLYHETKA